jgi:8-oxo-dGTP pyrophosphatase MutT (NUDIX family)
VSEHELPEWLRQLSHNARTVEPSAISRFLPPADGSGRRSAVLILFSDNPVPSVLVEERAATLRAHAGQVAFPGGAVDADDADAVATALREAEEEVGLRPDGVHVFGALPAMFLPVSSFVVDPVLAWWAAPHTVAAVDPGEVAGAHLLPVAGLVDPANRFRVRHPSGFVGPGFEVDGVFVWGFTAGLLDAVLRLGGFARDWDETRVRELPD